MNPFDSGSDLAGYPSSMNFKVAAPPPARRVLHSSVVHPFGQSLLQFAGTPATGGFLVASGTVVHFTFGSTVTGA